MIPLGISVVPLYPQRFRTTMSTQEEAIPLYTYQCGSCGLRFDKRVSSGRSSEGVPCESCESSAADRVVPESVRTTYMPKGDGTIRPQNTGVSSYDANVDRVIGDHSQKSWGVVAQRHSRKREVLRDSPDKTGWDLGRTVGGDYELIQPRERAAAETARGLHGRAMEMIERHKRRLEKEVDAGQTSDRP